MQRAFDAPRCFDYHATIAAAPEGWPDPHADRRWRLHKRRYALAG